MTDLQKQARLKVLRYQTNFDLDLEIAKKLAIKEYQSIIDYIDTKGNGYYTLPDDLKSDTDYYMSLISEVEDIDFSYKI